MRSSRLLAEERRASRSEAVFLIRSDPGRLVSAFSNHPAPARRAAHRVEPGSAELPFCELAIGADSSVPSAASLHLAFRSSAGQPLASTRISSSEL